MPSLQPLRQAFHGGDFLRVVVGVLVPLPVVQGFHQPGGRVPDHQGNRRVRLLFDGLLRFHDGHLHGVALAGQAHVDHRLRQMHAALRHADEVAGLVGRHADLHRPGIRQPHVLGGEAQHPPRDVQGILSALQHPRHPVYGGVRVGVAHGFVQRGDQVVVLLSVPVVHQAFPPQALGQNLVGHLDALLPGDPVQHDHLQGAQGAAGVAVAEIGDGLQRPFADGNPVPPESPLVRQRPPQQRQDVLPPECLQHKHLAPG